MKLHFNRAQVIAALFAAAIVAYAPPSGARNAAIAIDDPWAAQTNPGAIVAGGYVTLRNTGTTADRLISAASPRAQRVELHEMSMSDGMMRMRPVQGIDVPAGETATLAPGGLHIMFINIDAQFRNGEQVPVTLRFERAGAVEAVFVVRPRPSGGSGGHDH